MSRVMHPTGKERCPLAAMGRYLEWRRHDGSPFDPWIRAHERMGGEILAAAPESMTIRASVTDWEDWPACPSRGWRVRLPGRSGGAQRARQRGNACVEPNVWLLHRVQRMDV
ncbi:MAG TPA: hypothetical protein VFR38_00010 [Gaiellaceae bacterium]|nr:hypothetical protein [Gaiellaceae bacterium]